MALATTTDYQQRVNELLWYIERRFGIRMGDNNQDGTTAVSPALDEIVRAQSYTSGATETTAYADFKTLLWSYINYRNTKLGLPGGPGV
jgi:hypothetical protein